MFQMTQRVVDADHDSLQNFISDSKWRARDVIDRVAQQVNEKIGDPNDAALILDESGIAKKGEKSVGVARQWLGSVGKVDNGQVGVFAALCRNGDASLVDARLYLPKEWTEDPERCRNAGVPEDCRTFKTKEEIALGMVSHARESGLQFGVVEADGGYGKGLKFMIALDEMGEMFLVDVHCDTRVFLQQPQPYLPEKAPDTRGRTPTRFVADEKPVRVDALVKRQPQSAWVKQNIREGTKGTVQYEILTRRIWVWDQDTENYYHWHLVVRRDPVTKSDLKYSFSNAAKDVSAGRLARLQAQRYWIERTFEDAKSECGMADYEVRGWDGWHHHMALVLLAQSFMLDERLLNREDVPLLSCADLIELLSATLPSKGSSIDDIATAMEHRHRKRQSAINSAIKCQGT
jgi:SRSO17 transposase